MRDKIIEEIDRAQKEMAGSEESRSLPWWRKRLQAVGISRIDLPPALGGSPACNVDALHVMHRLGAIDLNLRDIVGIGHSRLMADSDESEISQLGLRAASGEVFTSYAVTEAGAGSDLRRLETRAEPASDGYRLHGQKVAIYRLMEATHFLVLAKCGNEVQLFVCPANADGIRRVPRECIGLKANSWGVLWLDGVFLPASHLLSRRESATAMFARHFAYWRSAMAACSIGAARAALDLTAAWMGERQVFGRALLSDGGLSRQMEKFRGELFNFWLAALHVGERLDHGEGEQVILDRHVKGNGIHLAHRIVDWCLEHFGWRGCCEDHPLVAVRRDLACLRVSSGATDALLDSLARRWVKRFSPAQLEGRWADHYSWPGI